MAFWNKKEEIDEECVAVDMILPAKYAEKLKALCVKHGYDHAMSESILFEALLNLD